MKKSLRAMILTISAVLCWSTVAVAFKIGLRHADVLTIISIASFTSWLFLFIALLFSKKAHLLVNLKRKTYFLACVMGAINPCLYYFVLLKSYAYLPAQQAQAINYSWVITLTLLSVFFLKERLRPAQIFACILGYIGVLIIATNGDIATLKPAHTLGVILAFSSAIIWSSYWLINKNNTVDPVLLLFLQFSFALLFIIIGHCTSIIDITIPSTKGIISSVYVGLFEMGLTFVLWVNALRLSNTSRIANFIFLCPVISLFWIWCFLEEPIYPSTLVALGFILTAVALQSKKSA